MPEATEVRLELQNYLARTGMAPPDFARRINYSRETVYQFLNGNHSRISSNDGLIRAAIRDFIAAHPIATPIISSGRRSYYIYVRQGIRSLDLMKRVAESCGALGLGRVDRILRNLRFDLNQRKVLLVFDEAQHLSIECLETIRELLDQPPHCGLLFAGTHELEEIFTRQALELEQWRSRFHAGQALPGISEDEAAEIVHSELGLELSSQKIQRLISKSRITDLRNRGRYIYVSAWRLFWVIRELQGSKTS